MSKLSALEDVLRANAFNDDDQSDLCWDLYANSICVRLSATALARSDDAAEAFRLAGSLLEQVEAVGFKRRLGSVTATLHDDGHWDGRLIDVVLDPVP